MTQIQVVRGITMPFYPMRPATGRVVRADDVAEIAQMARDESTWIVQPKLNEHRACLAVIDKTVHVQNRHGGWYTKPVNNRDAFRKLPDRTVLDGGVFDGLFCPFELLALWGKPFLNATTAERVIMAMQMARLTGAPWRFERPTKAWLARLRDNLPNYEGVVLKRANAPYVIAGSATQENSHWLRRRWA